MNLVAKLTISSADDYCGPIAPSGRILAPPNADRNSMRAEGAPL